MDECDPIGLEPVELPISDELDLHAFQPREVKDLVPEYLRLCRERGILRVRIVHGKGTGALRANVHALLARVPWVETFAIAPADRGHWGATIVTLAPVTGPPGLGERATTPSAFQET
ncbi:MAG: Smr/MutS family protein [Candidatus Eisenbacteria bacterium]|jgi:DNA-nicking Smr family endonuclease|nr:Smr/MutS family protein [Candidatus Eisenbacteria bacterium]